MDVGAIGIALNLAFAAGLVWWLWQRRNQPRRRARSEAPPDHTSEAPPDHTSEASPGPPRRLPVTQVRFEALSSRLEGAAVAEVDRLALWLLEGEERLELCGSADESGPAASNRRLAVQRAAVVSRALRSHGVAADRLVLKALPPQPGRNEAERAALRRVVVRVL